MPDWEDVETSSSIGRLQTPEWIRLLVNKRQIKLNLIPVAKGKLLLK